MRLNFMIVAIACLALIISAFPFDLEAKSLLISPSIGVKGEYDNNVAFVPTEVEDDFIATVSPGAALTIGSELVDIKSNVAIDFLRYLDNTDLDTVNQLYELNGTYRSTPRWSFLGLVSYVKDTTLDSQLLETGRVSARENRRRFDIDGGIAHKLTEASNIEFNYHFKHVNFDSDIYVDYKRNSVALSYNRKLQDQINTIGAQTAYYYRDSDVSDLHEINQLLSLEHLFTPKIRLFLSAGVSYSEQEYKNDQSTDKYWMPIGDGFIRWQGENSAYTLGYRKDIRTDTNGRALDVDRIYCRLRHNLSERWGVSLIGTIYLSEEIDKSGDKGSIFFNVDPSIFYKLTENHTLHLTYKYSVEKDREREDDQISTRNQIGIRIEFNFPKQFEY